MDSPDPGAGAWADWRLRLATRSLQVQQRWRSRWQPRLRRIFQDAASPAPPVPLARSPSREPPASATRVPAPADTAPPATASPTSAQPATLLPTVSLLTTVSPTVPQPNTVPTIVLLPTSELPNTTPTCKVLQTATQPRVHGSPPAERDMHEAALAVDSSEEGSESHASAVEPAPSIGPPSIRGPEEGGLEEAGPAIRVTGPAGAALVGAGLAVVPDATANARRSPATVQDWVDSLPPPPCSREASGGDGWDGARATSRGAALAREASLASDAGSHSSVESLLGSRRADPEEVLLGLGFGGGGGDLDSDVARIPRRFLRPSQVRGVVIDDFLRHQHDLVHTFESGCLGYRGLTGPGFRPPSEIVGKIMEKLRGQRAPYSPAGRGGTRFSRAARQVMRSLPGSVLTPGNREFLDQQGGKSPEVSRKRMVIGQRSFAFDQEGHLIDLRSDSSRSDSSSEDAVSSLSRSDTIGSEPLARRLSFPGEVASPISPSAPGATWSPLAQQRRRRSLKRQPRVDDDDPTDADQPASLPGESAQGMVPVVEEAAISAAAPADVMRANATQPGPTEGYRTLPAGNEVPTGWSKLAAEPAAAPSLMLRERAALLDVPRLRILVDTVVHQHSLEKSCRLDDKEDEANADREAEESKDRQGDHKEDQDEGKEAVGSGDVAVGAWSRGADYDQAMDEEDEGMVTDRDRVSAWVVGRGAGRLQVLTEESEAASDSGSVGSSALEEALTRTDATAVRRMKLAALGPSDSSGFSDQEDSLDQLTQELKRRGVEPGASAVKAALAAFGAALGCAEPPPTAPELEEVCSDLRQLRELRDAVARQLRRVADLVDEQPDGVAGVTAQIAELLRRQSRLGRRLGPCAAPCCDVLVVMRDGHRHLESLVQRNSRELAEIRRLLQQLLPAQAQ